MKRKRFTALKVTLTAMMLTAALTSGAGSAYAADLSQEGGSEPTVTITPSPEVTPELPLPTSTPKPTPVPKNGLLNQAAVTLHDLLFQRVKRSETDSCNDQCFGPEFQMRL